MRISIFSGLVILAVLISGCGKSSDPVQTPTDLQDSLTSESGIESRADENRVVWGYWDVSISADRQEISTVPNRNGTMHLNALSLLEQNPCSSCFKASIFQKYPPNDLRISLSLHHPFNDNPKLTAFDPRAVLITDSDYTFPVGNRKIAWDWETIRLANPDGYTSLYNPAEFPDTNPPYLRYIPGDMALGDGFTATLNAYSAFVKDNPRRMLESGEHTYHYAHIHLPDGPVKFGYAVDACWKSVAGEVTDPETDFPPDANCIEAYRIDVELEDILDPAPGSSSQLQVAVYDHQGLDTIATVIVEAPDLFVGSVELVSTPASGEEYHLYTAAISNDLGADIDEYPLLIRVIDTESDPNLGSVDAWQVFKVRVGKTGWVRTWGGQYVDNVIGMAVDGAGNVYATGMFTSPVDFDPGIRTDEHLIGDQDYGRFPFISKFNTYGDYQWAVTWGGTTDGVYGTGLDIALDGLGNIYVAGSFHGIMDFDPGPGTDFKGSVNSEDYFLSKFDNSGQYQWSRTWVGIGTNGVGDRCAVAAAEDGSAYVTGIFVGTVDFNPGAGTDLHTSNGHWDIFVLKFDQDGVFQWCETWGGEENDEGWDIALDPFSNLLVTGTFRDTVDLNPGTESDWHDSLGSSDIFLTKLSSTGDFLWARTWGGTSSDSACGVASDITGNIAVSGAFRSIVDFDPGPGIDEHNTPDPGNEDAFVSKFDPDGTFIWAATWGGFYAVEAMAVTHDQSGNILATGHFEGLVDFDPGPGIFELESTSENRDLFLSKLGPDGSFFWAGNWGGSDSFWSLVHRIDISTDPVDNSYIAGYFMHSVDFDPGPDFYFDESNGSIDCFISKFPPDGNW